MKRAGNVSDEDEEEPKCLKKTKVSRPQMDGNKVAGSVKSKSKARIKPSGSGVRPLKRDGTRVEVTTQPEASRRKASAIDKYTSLRKVPSPKHGLNSVLTLRTRPTVVTMEVNNLRGEASFMNTQMIRGESSCVLDLTTKMSERPSVGNCDVGMNRTETVIMSDNSEVFREHHPLADQHMNTLNSHLTDTAGVDERVRRGQTVIMSEDCRDTYRQQSPFNNDMKSCIASGCDTMMSVGNSQSFMDTDSQTSGLECEMTYKAQDTSNNFRLHINNDTSKIENDVDDVHRTALPGTSITIKTEPSFFGTAFDDLDDDGDNNMLPVTRTSTVDMSPMPSSSQVVTQQGFNAVEDVSDCKNDTVPVLHTRYSVKSEPHIRPRSSFKRKLVVKLKNKAVSRYQPYSKKGKTLAKVKHTETMPAAVDDTGLVIKCEPMSDTEMDLDLNQDNADGNASGDMAQTKPGKRTSKRTSAATCHLCQQMFCSASSLKRHHKRKHSTDNLQFSCSFCDLKFARLVQLRAHERMHRGGDKTFPCQQCDVVFTRACHLTVHMRKHTGERPYTCSIPDCNSTFRSTSNLNRHMMKHSGLRPYICTVCDANFYQASHLVSHVRKHTGERPFCCKKCDATFTQLTHLHRHLTKHTGKKPYSCETCGAGFVERCALRKHMKKHKDLSQGTSVDTSDRS